MYTFFMKDGNTHNLLKSVMDFAIATGIIILIVFVVGNLITDSSNTKDWTLFLYSSEQPHHMHLIQRIDGYENQTDCLEKGYLMAQSGSYECGYYCRYEDKYLMEICNKVCGANGCRD